MDNWRIQKKSLVHGAAPLLTAVDRFLYGQKNDTLCSKKIDQTILEKTRVIETRNNDKENTMFGLMKEKNLAVYDGNKKKRPYSIKGQWTAEEDRKLIKLVRQHGDRKWAIVSEKIEGRAGKQCRERWHNHLRPDIKKDGWSEEEEKVLVEAHSKIGNKWAEIAKLIQGRTENSIKNHWNATKRRQNSKRKHKRSRDDNRDVDDLSPSAKRPCVLEDYIRSIENNAKDNTEKIITTCGSNNVLLTSNLEQFDSDGDSTSTILDNPYEDELVFLKNMFANPKPKLDNKFFGTHHGTMVTDPANTSHLASDIYLSDLLNGASSSSSSSNNIEYSSQNDLLAPQANSTGERRELDLIEMLADSTQVNNIWFPFY